MSYHFPVVDLTDPELLWLREVYSRLGREEVDILSLKAALWEKIPKDFNPRGIDPRIILYGVKLTLYGVWLVDRSSKWIEATGDVITAIRGHLLENPRSRGISSEEIAAITHLPQTDVEIIFGFIMDLGRFWSSASGNRVSGYSQLSFDGEEYFDEYLRFEGIEPLLDRFIAGPISKKQTEKAYWTFDLETDREIQYDVFVSYSSEDREEARTICEAIEESGGRVFLAEKNLTPGDQFDERIREALTTARELWLLVTPHSLKSEWVLTEWGAAWALQKKIVPILYRCRPDELPDRLRRRQAIDFHKCPEFIKTVFKSEFRQ